MDPNLPPQAAEKQLEITRTYNAPRELVFRAWTEADHLKQWWGPAGFDLGVQKLEVIPGGTFHYYMQAAGQKMWGKFVYREIAAPERLVFVNSFSDESENLTRAPFSETWPKEMLNIITLNEHNGQTTMTLTGFPVNATEEERKTYSDGIPSMQQGFASTFDKLEQYLDSVQE